MNQTGRVDSSARHGRERYVLSRNKSHVCTMASRGQRGANAQALQFGHCGQICGSNRPFGVECAALQLAARFAP